MKRSIMLLVLPGLPSCAKEKASDRPAGVIAMLEQDELEPDLLQLADLRAGKLGTLRELDGEVRTIPGADTAIVEAEDRVWRLERADGRWQTKEVVESDPLHEAELASPDGTTIVRGCEGLSGTLCLVSAGNERTTPFQYADPIGFLADGRLARIIHHAAGCEAHLVGSIARTSSRGFSRAPARSDARCGRAGKPSRRSTPLARRRDE